MKKGLALAIIGLLLVVNVLAQPTRLYTPIVKQATYATIQVNTIVWEPTQYDYIVLTGFVISSNTDQEITLVASDPIVKVAVKDSLPVVSPDNFLWKGSKNEVILITSTAKTTLDITLFGYEQIE